MRQCLPEPDRAPSGQPAIDHPLDDRAHVLGQAIDGDRILRARGPVHPRSYGTYPRILGRYVREQRVLSLEDAVRKMSGAVASPTSAPEYTSP